MSRRVRRRDLVVVAMDSMILHCWGWSLPLLLKLAYHVFRVEESDRGELGIKHVLTT